jgi:hypothetical protein
MALKPKSPTIASSPAQVQKAKEKFSLTYYAARGPWAKTANDLSKLVQEYYEEGKIPRWLNVLGVAVDDSVNANNWKVLTEDLDKIAEQLKGAQYRKNHGDSIDDIVGKVEDAWREEDKVFYKARVINKDVIEKILMGLAKNDSIQLMSDDIYCSSCYDKAKKDMMSFDDARYPMLGMPHACGGLEFIVANPQVVELSIVATPAYANAEFMPLSFSASMNQKFKDRYIKMQCDKNGCYEAPSTDKRAADRKNVSVLRVLSQSLKAEKEDTTNAGGGFASPDQHTYNELLSTLTKAIKEAFGEVTSPLTMKLEEMEKREEAISNSLEKISNPLKPEAKKSEEKKEEEAEEESHSASKGKTRIVYKPIFIRTTAKSPSKVKAEEEAKHEEEEEAQRKKEERGKRLEEVRKKIEERRKKLTEASVKSATAQGKGLSSTTEDAAPQALNIQAPAGAQQLPPWMKELLTASKDADKRGYVG